MGPTLPIHVQTPSVVTTGTSNNISTWVNSNINHNGIASHSSTVTYTNGATITTVEEVSANLRSLIPDLTRAIIWQSDSDNGLTGDDTDKPAVDYTQKKSPIRKLWRFICRFPRLCSCIRDPSEESKLSEKERALLDPGNHQHQASVPSLSQSQNTDNVVVTVPQQPDSLNPPPPKPKNSTVVTVRNAALRQAPGPTFTFNHHSNIFDDEGSSPQTSRRTYTLSGDDLFSQVSWIIVVRASKQIFINARRTQQDIGDLVRSAMRLAAQATEMVQTSLNDEHRTSWDIIAAGKVLLRTWLPSQAGRKAIVFTHFCNICGGHRLDIHIIRARKKIKIFIHQLSSEVNEWPSMKNEVLSRPIMAWSIYISRTQFA